MISKASNEILVLVDQINTYIATREAPFIAKVFPLQKAIGRIRQEFIPRLQERNIIWKQSDYLPEIKADKTSVLRCLRNLIDNALKYGGEKITEISIDYLEDSRFHQLCVKDDGPGIEGFDHDNLFSLFKREKNATGTPGAGLGLAIVKEIAERHQGKVWVEPLLPTGSNFCFSIAKNLTNARNKGLMTS